MNSLLTLSGDSRPAAEPVIGAASVALGAFGSISDEATQLALDFASALAALSGGEPARPSPAADAEVKAGGDELQADLRDLLQVLEQGLPAAQPMVAMPVEPEPADPADAAQVADMPAMDGLLQLLQPQLAAQVQSAPLVAEMAADAAVPSAQLPARNLPTNAQEPAPANLPAPPAAAAQAPAGPASAGDDAQLPAEIKVVVPTARAEPAFGATVQHTAKTDSDVAEGAAAIDGGSPATALSSPQPAPQIKTSAAVAHTVLHLPDTQPRQWQQPLMQALGDRLQLQIAARSEQAVIRLEPPLLGRVEIAIQHQAGDLQVRLSASHPEVTRQLQHISDGLRQELAQRQSGEVSVQVSQRALGDQGSQTDQQPGQRRQAEAEGEARKPGRALREDTEAQAPTFAQRLGGRSKE